MQCTDALRPGENSGAHGIGGSVGCKASLNEIEEKTLAPPHRNSNPGPPIQQRSDVGSDLLCITAVSESNDNEYWKVQ